MGAGAPRWARPGDVSVGEPADAARQHRADIWQGRFRSTTVADGYPAAAPVDSFARTGSACTTPPATSGKWTADWFSPTWHQQDHAATRVDP